jgi:hypothetical protein
MCAICDLDIAFAVDHPMTLPVAVATRAAIEEGCLDPAPDDPAGTLGTLRARTRAVEALRAVQDRLERTLAPERLVALPDFFVLMIETRTWGFFRPTPSGFDPNCRPVAPRVAENDPADRDAAIIVSETAARGICEGRLSFDAATSQGLIAVDADADRRNTLVAAWRVAYPETGFSRFVCA